MTKVNMLLIKFKIFGYITHISSIYSISMDPDMKFEKIYPSTNIFGYFTHISSFFSIFFHILTDISGHFVIK